MSWNLRIYKPGKPGPGQGASEPLGQIGTIPRTLAAALPGLEWASATECNFPGRPPFSITLVCRSDAVTELHTVGDWGHLTRVVPVCRQQAWRMALIDDGKDLDVDFYALAWERRELWQERPA